MVAVGVGVAVSVGLVGDCGVDWCGTGLAPHYVWQGRAGRGGVGRGGAAGQGRRGDTPHLVSAVQDAALLTISPPSLLHMSLY